jgi:hypothetical protein
MADGGIRVGVALAALAAVLAGCGGSATATEEPGPVADRTTSARQLVADAYAKRRAVRIPAGYDVRHVTAEGFSLAFPRRWTALAQHDVVFPGVIRTLSSAHRSLTPSLLGLASPDSPLKLLAFDGRAGEDFATTASLFVGPAPPGATFQRQGAAVVRAVRRLDGLSSGIDVRRLELPAGAALRLQYVRKGLMNVQYLTVRGDRLYALVYATRPALVRHYAPVFAASARTFSLER